MVGSEQRHLRRPETATGQLNRALTNRRDAMDAEKDQFQPPEVRTPNGKPGSFTRRKG